MMQNGASNSKKTIHIAGDDDIEIEEQGGPGEVVQGFGEQGDLPKGRVFVTRRQVDRRQRLALDGRLDIGRVVREANEAKWQRQMSGDAAIQLVHIVGTIDLPPFQADDVDHRG